MINELISQEDLAMFTSAGRITLGSIYFEEGMKDNLATFEVFIRPDEKRNYFVLAGINSLLDIMPKLKFNKEHLDFLKKVYNFSEGYLAYLGNLKFSGDIWAMPEGTICFPYEPLVRITAPLIQICLIEQLVINTIMHQTMLASKFARIRIASKDKLVGTTLVRAHGMESSLKSVRISREVGIDISAMALYGMKNADFKAEGGVSTHFFVQSFDTEIESFKAYFRHNAEKGIMLIDTYNYDTGIENFIKAAKESEINGRKVRGIIIDSGDHIEISKKVREKLDKAGLEYIKILAMGNLDEYKITEFMEKKAPIDIFGVATEALNCTDLPKLEVVFKMVELEKDGKFIPIIKLAQNKITYPGKKQVCIFHNAEGRIVARIICREGEFKKSLLLKMVERGELVYKIPVTEDIKNYFFSQINSYPPLLFNLREKFEFPVLISEGLQDLFEQTKKKFLSK